ncbi:ubiquitin-conjugating enzyme E2 N [Coccidioides immitis RMSCC 2394]|uniref:E2 ubiquitin-conjugating enzyme n=1 Tax=Coccidioides immitis RMSCC 2394 TaxID=404692 RepID=A0A0J7BC70_COCIT|nr:ubiquitin-conjugating enzyme E2 N [Coccidioides immitis RMSCC 2394]
MGSQKRIAKELGELTKAPPPGIQVSLADEADLYKWEIHMQGPDDSPYKGGTFVLNLVLPPEYPFKPPTVSFTTKIYHPNVTNDGKGTVCLEMLRADEWKPSTKLQSVLEFARQLLSEPMPDDAVEGKIAEQFNHDRKAFDQAAKE